MSKNVMDESITMKQAIWRKKEELQNLPIKEKYLKTIAFCKCTQEGTTGSH